MFPFSFLEIQKRGIQDDAEEGAWEREPPTGVLEVLWLGHGEWWSSSPVYLQPQNLIILYIIIPVHASLLYKFDIIQNTHIIFLCLSKYLKKFALNFSKFAMHFVSKYCV